MRIMRVLRGLVLLSVAFAFFAVGIFLLSLRTQTKQASAGVISTMTLLVKDVDSITKSVDDVKVMTNATLFQAEEVLHHTDILVATETRSQAVQLAKINTALDQLAETVQNLDDTQAQVGGDVHAAMIALPPAIEQARATLAEAQKTIAEGQKTLAATTTDLSRLQPAIDNIDKTTEHINSMSASLDTVIKDATKPKPWYKKVFGYIWAPLKIAATFSGKP